MRPQRLLPGGTALDLVGKEDLLRNVETCLHGQGRPLVLASSNLDHLTHFGVRGPHRDPALAATDADWIVTADGMPLVWWARHRSQRRVSQLAGSDLLPTLLTVAEQANARIAFVGGWPEQHERLADVLSRRYPTLDVAGFWAPTRDDLHRVDRQIQTASQIATTGAQLLVVGLGKPRQELWLAGYLGMTGCRVGLAYGAAADFLAGTAARAPAPLRRLGLEWLYRLVHEPRRLWRRYLLEGPGALWLLCRSPR